MPEQEYSDSDYFEVPSPMGVFHLKPTVDNPCNNDSCVQL